MHVPVTCPLYCLNSRERMYLENAPAIGTWTKENFSSVTVKILFDFNELGVGIKVNFANYNPVLRFA